MKFIPDFQDFEMWDRYVNQHPEARFCHLSAYRCLEGIYGYRPFYMAFLEDNQLVGVLPAFEAKSVFFGKRLVSQPFSEYGGLLANGNLSSKQLAEVFGHVREFLKFKNLASLEMHGRQGVPAESATSFLVPRNKQHYAELSLDQPLDVLYNEILAYQVRKAVQKARRAKLVVEEHSDPDWIRRYFFPLYLASMKRLGSPPHSIRYYLECHQAFRSRMQIYWALLDGKPIAGLLGFSSGSRINIVSIVSDPLAWEHRPNDLIHWEYIQKAHESRFRHFDFGSVRYDGQLQYKKKWGCTISEHAYYFVNADTSAGVRSFSSSSNAMSRLSSLWGKYVPDAGARILGPFLRRYLIR